MKLHKLISTSMLITIVAVGYVHQRVEIVKTGYSLQESRKSLARVVDQNSKLMYNLSKLESPRNLLASLNGEDIEFRNHRIGRTNSYQVAYGKAPKEPLKSSLAEKFFDLFTVNAEARPRE